MMASAMSTSQKARSHRLPLCGMRSVKTSTVACAPRYWQIGRNAKIANAIPACTTSKSPGTGPTPVPISHAAKPGAKDTSASLLPRVFSPRPNTLMQVMAMSSVRTMPPKTAITHANVPMTLRTAIPSRHVLDAVLARPGLQPDARLTSPYWFSAISAVARSRRPEPSMPAASISATHSSMVACEASRHSAI